jgi:two-component system, cell cycle response regulator
MAEERDDNEKTSVVGQDTFKYRLKGMDEAPPAIIMMIGPASLMGKQWLLVDGEMVIGRSSDCGVSVDDRSLSRQHARVAIVGNDVSIMDMGSTNKTVVNGQTMPPMVPHRLKNNDQIKTGNVVFKFLEKGNIEAATMQAMHDRMSKDRLTGAFSRASLQDKAPEAIKRADTLSEDLSIVVFDIDFFKKINDNHGHPGGDYVLTELSKVIMQKVARSNDYFARYGGEEFVVILSGSNNKQALEVGERLRQTVESHRFFYENKQIPVTVSAGVATWEPGEAWEDLFKRADTALYFSKNNGRNRVTSA